MTSIITNQFPKEENPTDNKYQLNMEILTSLKSLPGKVVNLQSEKIIFNNEDINKKVIFPEEKFTTSSSISKEILNDPFSPEGEKIHKKSYSTNSVFKPIACYPIKRTTMNYYNLGSMMSFSEQLLPNPSQFNPLKITDGSYSKNSFYNMMNQDGNGIIINTVNNFNPNCNGNTINNINTFNGINPIISFLPNFTQSPLINEQILKKSSLNQNKNNIFLNKKRGLYNDNNANFDIKEIKETKEELNDNIKNNNNIKNNLPKAKSKFFYVKQSQTQKVENPTKKNLFTVIQKSNYVYRKRKPRKKKLFNGLRYKIKCAHEGCEGIFKTKKQLVYHHYKMSLECHNDTINLLKMINSTKTLLLKKIEKKEELSKKYAELYRETMKNISLDEHIETIVGVNFEDKINKD